MKHYSAHITIAIALALLSGCVTMGPYTPQPGRTAPEIIADIYDSGLALQRHAQAWEAAKEAGDQREQLRAAIRTVGEGAKLLALLQELSDAVGVGLEVRL